MCGVFRGGRMPPRKIPPAPRTRCEASGAQAGCAFFAPGFFAQAKKGGSRRHGAKALDVDSVAKREKNKSSSLRSRPHPALRATFSRRREKGSPPRSNRSLELQPAPHHVPRLVHAQLRLTRERLHAHRVAERVGQLAPHRLQRVRSEEHTSELQSLMRISYAVFCLKKKNTSTLL